MKLRTRRMQRTLTTNSPRTTPLVGATGVKFEKIRKLARPTKRAKITAMGPKRAVNLRGLVPKLCRNVFRSPIPADKHGLEGSGPVTKNEPALPYYHAVASLRHFRG